jgi:hypothetical protein
MRVGEVTLKLAASTPLKRTAVTSTNSVPRISTVPPTDSDVGEKLEIAGAAKTTLDCPTASSVAVRKERSAGSKLRSPRLVQNERFIKNWTRPTNA